MTARRSTGSCDGTRGNGYGCGVGAACALTISLLAYAVRSIRRAAGDKAAGPVLQIVAILHSAMAVAKHPECCVEVGDAWVPVLVPPHLVEVTIANVQSWYHHSNDVAKLGHPVHYAAAAAVLAHARDLSDVEERSYTLKVHACAASQRHNLPVPPLRQDGDALVSVDSFTSKQLITDNEEQPDASDLVSLLGVPEDVDSRIEFPGEVEPVETTSVAPVPAALEQDEEVEWIRAQLINVDCSGPDESVQSSFACSMCARTAGGCIQCNALARLRDTVVVEDVSTKMDRDMEDDADMGVGDQSLYAACPSCNLQLQFTFPPNVTAGQLQCSDCNATFVVSTHGAT